MKSTMDNPFSLEGKNILITGASSGIGQQCAVRCSLSGAKVIITGRDVSRLDNTFGKLRPGEHSKFSADLSDFGSYDSILSEVLLRYKKIDGLVHCAGAEKTIPLQMMKPINFQALLNINVVSGFELARLLYIKNSLRDGSSLVFISSIMGILGQAGKIGYCSSKGAVISGVKAMALELAPRLIRANAILPAVCHSPMTDKMFAGLSEEGRQRIISMHPLGIGDPDDIALAAVYLLSDASKWITGTSLIADGGYSAQ